MVGGQAIGLSDNRLALEALWPAQGSCGAWLRIDVIDKTRSETFS